MSTEVQNFDYIMDVNGGEGDWSNILWRLQYWKFYRECGRWGTAGSSSTHPWNNTALGRSRSGPPANQRAGPAVGEAAGRHKRPASDSVVLLRQQSLRTPISSPQRISIFFFIILWINLKVLCSELRPWKSPPPHSLIPLFQRVSSYKETSWVLSTGRSGLTPKVSSLFWYSIREFSVFDSVAPPPLLKYKIFLFLLNSIFPRLIFL